MHAENTRLRQELAKAKDIMQQALPNYQLGEALRKAKGGGAIIEKLQKGEELSAAQEAKAEEFAESQGLSLKQLEEVFEKKLQTFEENLWQAQKAERDMQRLHERAKKEFPGYENVYQSPQFKRLQGLVLNQAQEDPSVIPDDEPDPYWWILKESIGIMKYKNPDLWEEKPAKKTESERQGAIAGVSQKSGGAPDKTEEVELPDYVKNLGSRRFGKSLRDLRTKS